LGDRRDIPVNAHVHAQPKRIAVQVHNPRPVCCRVQRRHPSPALVASRQEVESQGPRPHSPPCSLATSLCTPHHHSHCTSSRSGIHQLHGMSVNGPAESLMYTIPPRESSPSNPLPLPSHLDPPRKLSVCNRRSQLERDVYRISNAKGAWMCFHTRSSRSHASKLPTPVQSSPQLLVSASGLRLDASPTGKVNHSSSFIHFKTPPSAVKGAPPDGRGGRPRGRPTGCQPGAVGVGGQRWTGRRAGRCMTSLTLALIPTSPGERWQPPTM